MIQRRQTEPDVWLHVRQLVGQDVADHLHRHPITRHLLPHSQSPAMREKETEVHDGKNVYMLTKALFIPREFIFRLDLGMSRSREATEKHLVSIDTRHTKPH